MYINDVMIYVTWQRQDGVTYVRMCLPFLVTDTMSRWGDFCNWNHQKSCRGKTPEAWRGGIHPHGRPRVKRWAQRSEVANSIPETTDFLTNSSEQSTDALVPLSSHQWSNWYQLGVVGWGWDNVRNNATQSHSGEHLVPKRLYAILEYV